MLWFDLHALIVAALLLPCLDEVLKIQLEGRQWIVIGQRVLDEVLDDHKNEQVEHDIRDNHDERKEEDRSDWRATCTPRDAFWSQSHAIIHDSIPIFSCRNRE